MMHESSVPCLFQLRP